MCTPRIKSTSIVQNNHRNSKRDPATLDNRMTPAADHRQKKLCHPGANDLGNRLRLVSDMGMFFLTKPDMKAFPKMCPTRSVPISLVKVESVPVRIAPLVTQRIHVSSNPIQLLQCSRTFSLRKLDGSMNGTGAMPILLTKPKLSWKAKMALLPVRRLDMF